MALLLKKPVNSVPPDVDQVMFLNLAIVKGGLTSFSITYTGHIWTGQLLELDGTALKKQHVSGKSVAKMVQITPISL